MIFSLEEKVGTEFSQPKCRTLPHCHIAPMASAWCLTTTMKQEEETEEQEPSR